MNAPSSMISMDTETLLILQGNPAPPAVCLSYVEEGAPHLVTDEEMHKAARRIITSSKTVVGANLAFDFAVLAAERPELLPEIFKMYSEGRVFDVLIAQALDAIAGGHLGIDPRTGGSLKKPSSGKDTKRYSLEVVSDLVLGRRDAKESAHWRLSYGLLQDIPVERWPEWAAKYPIDDVKNPLDIAKAQREGVGRHVWNDTKCIYCGVEIGYTDVDPICGFAPRETHQNLHNLAFQCEAAFALHLGACWSLRTDPEKVAVLEAEVEKKHLAMQKRFQVKGWIRPDGSEDQAAVKKAVVEAYGGSGQCPRCRGTGKIATIKTKACRGEKIKGRFQGCGGSSCSVCSGSGEISYVGGDIVCKASATDHRCPLCGEVQYAHPSGGFTCPNGHAATEMSIVSGCDGTGLDLRTVPDLRRTDAGGISADRDAKMESGDEDLAEYGEDEFEKSRSTYLPYLRTGIYRPLNYSPNVLVASGRCSYEGSPLHQMPRAGKERECVRARGAWCGSPIEYVLGSTDYEAGELCTLAQYLYWIFGHSKMRDVINETGKPGILHSDLAAVVMGITLDEFTKKLKAFSSPTKRLRDPNAGASSRTC